ncbi:MAG: membrane protein insertase YidC [Bacteroidetes bacterium SW_11_45_7]|nr:MAG: membrane protein insertase YidC [Bacteroidetes bacterium SW_11_45_7]
MDRNTVIGFILILIILVIYSLYNYQNLQEQRKREQEKQKKEQIAGDTTSPAESASPPGQKQGDTSREKLTSQPQDDTTQNGIPASRSREFGPFAHAASGTVQYDTIENEKMVAIFSNKGGAIHKVRLKDYMRYDSLPLVLFDGDEKQLNYQFFTRGNKSIQTKNLYFSPSKSGSFSISGNEDHTISYKVELGDGQYLEQKYTLTGNTNLLDYEVNFVNLDQYLSPNAETVKLTWRQKLKKLEKSMTSSRRYSALYYKSPQGGLEHLSQSGSSEYSVDKPLDWISYKQQFFNATLIPRGDFFDQAKMRSTTNENSDYVKILKTDMEFPFNPGKDNYYSMKFYLGPNQYNTLANVEDGLQGIIPLAPDFFLFSWVSFINKWLIIPLFNFLNSFMTNFGIIILLLTLVIKTILFPLTYRSFKSMAKMKVIQPEIQELKEKYGDDQQKFGTEQWKLFQKAGVNPLGGCLPMLLQMPILISMYYFFPSSIELRQEGFLWAQDLSTYDSILHLGFSIPLYGDHVSLFTLLMFVSSILYAATNPQMSGGGSGPQAQMKWMPYIFPFMLLFIFNSFPAALTYYYFLSNIITYAQQFIIKRFIVSEEQIHEQIQEKKKQPAKKSKFQQRLEDIAKQQQEKQQEIQKKKKKKK